MTKIKVPEPKAHVGERSAKELTNFVWDMKQYFKATKVSNVDRVFITSVYLAEPSICVQHVGGRQAIELPHEFAVLGAIEVEETRCWRP
ncbi:unnamed protein product [Prunus armeniaca]